MVDEEDVGIDEDDDENGDGELYASTNLSDDDDECFAEKTFVTLVVFKCLKKGLSSKVCCC